MIFLSRLLLDPFSRRVQKDLMTPYEMHRTLCHAFPDLSDEAWRASRVLFRADEDNNRLTLLVQSHEKPDWEAFCEHLKRKDEHYLQNATEVASREWTPHFQNGQSLRFRLQANPVFAPKENGAKNGVRRGLFREAERLDWLRRQSQTHGFELSLGEKTLQAWVDSSEKRHPIFFRGERKEEKLKLDLPICEIVDLNDGRRFELPSQKTQFSAARFDGVLRVSDPTKFALAVENGIGKARGFGFGLLSVAPPTK